MYSILYKYTRISPHVLPSSSSKTKVGSLAICNSTGAEHVLNAFVASTIDIPRSLRLQA